MKNTSHLPAYEEGTGRVSETLAYKVQMPENYPEESIKQLVFIIFNAH